MMQWLSTFAAMSLSFIALAGALWCLLRVRKLLRGASPKSLAALSVEVAELQSAFESLSAGHRKLAARVGMREVRERRRDEGEPPTGGGGGAGIGEKLLSKAELKDIARARGHKIS